MIDWIKSTTNYNTDATIYSLDDAKARYEVHELLGEGYLILNFIEDRSWLKFAVLTLNSSNANGTNTYLDVQFYGEGAPETLRECRHTYWGDDGYLFYPNGKVITAAFNILSEYFDDLR